MRSFLDRALDRRRDDSDLLGIERRGVEDVDGAMQALGSFDSLVERGEDVGVAAGSELPTGRFTECSVPRETHNTTTVRFQGRAVDRGGLALRIAGHSQVLQSIRCA